MTIRIGRRGAILGATAALAAPALAQAPRDIVFSLDFTALGRHAGWYVALERGFYREAGMNVRIVPGQGTGQAVQAVESGVAQLSFSDVAALVTARLNSNATTKMVSVIYQKAPYCLFSLESGANVRRPEQMVGLQVGTGAGSLTSKVFEAYMIDRGLDHRSLRFVNIDPTARVAVLVSKRVASIDLFLMAEPGIRRAAQNAGESAVTFFFADHGLELYSNGILAREDFLAANGDLVRRFIAASLRGWRECLADPSAGADMFLRSNRGHEKPVVMAEIDIVKRLISTEQTQRAGLGAFDMAAMSRSVAFVARVSEGGGRIGAEDVATTAYLPTTPLLG
jgi:NitT/TauT family transport system substrate-binding protein